MARKARDYRFRGRPVDGRGRSLEEALDSLSDFWNSRPSLVMHDYGVIELQISIGGTLTVVEVSDRKVIDRVTGGDLQALVDHLASKAGVSSLEMKAMLDRVDEVVATVDRIRPPTDPDYWRASPGTEPEVVLPTVVSAWAAEAAKSKKVDAADRRRLTALVAVVGHQEGKSLAQISAESGIPRSTLRDALIRDRREREEIVLVRPKGGRLTDNERTTVVRLYAETENAADVGRRLQMSDRTVRGIVGREKEAVRKLRRSSLQDRLLELVESGTSASAAGRQIGIPERTARSWVRKMMSFEEE